MNREEIEQSIEHIAIHRCSTRQWTTLPSCISVERYAYGIRCRL
jgi:hypothetical protein